MTLLPGTKLGRYEIRATLGQGGMGEVYLAYDRELERNVAVKVLRGDREESGERIRRFVQEAKAASALNHPNVATVYEIGSADDLRFIAMEVVEGETLRDLLSRGQMSFDDVLSIGSQIAAALGAAHAIGIVHRDIKPENVIVRPDGYAKVLDFGLAKLNQARAQDAETVMRTNPGMVMGTLRYMAPEQFAGSEVTPAADVFSLGVVLYEMVAGRRPFDGASPTEVVTAILTQTPPSLYGLKRPTPPRLAAVIEKALSKEAEQRFSSGAELLEELKQISRESTASLDLGRSPIARSKGARRFAVATMALLVLAGVLGAAWIVRRSNRLTQANATIASAERLLAANQFAEAFDAADSAASLLPNDPRLIALMTKTSTKASFVSDPPGATVFLSRFKGSAERVRAGTTPLTIERLARADYVVSIEKEGFTPVSRPLSLAPSFVRGLELRPPPAELLVKLDRPALTPADMVRVEGGTYRLTGWSRPTDRAVELREFLIDRYEVSNREFESFVRAGGYRRRDLWKHPFVLDGRTLSFEEALTRFHDQTGLPGPRAWKGGAPAEGKEDHPVTGITWFEAAAFAEWKGKSLPTVFQWEKAARFPMRGAVGSSLPWGVVTEGVDVTERANFRGKGTMPVGSLPFGISPWGAHQMAGNVAEWCVNASGPGHAIRGGGWDDAIYTFGRSGAVPAFFVSESLGFRCVSRSSEGSDPGSFALSSSVEIPEYKPVDDATFERFRRRYEYAKTPLDARVVETVETAEWRREKIVYRVAGADVPAYLYLPKGFPAPLQVIHFAPAGDVVSGMRALPASTENNLAAMMRAGRAVFTVVMEGFSGRPWASSYEAPDRRTVEYTDYVVSQVTELRRGLDYLETRKEVDMTRVAFMGPSAGSWAGVILTALEPRYRSVLFIGTHIEPSEMTDEPAANRINFAPRIAAPKMMLQGRFDESAPFDTMAMPLFRLLREPKRLEVYEGSHVPPQDIAIPVTTKWFDETLGPVGH